MPFRPNEITKEHVLRAVAKVESENIPLIPSTRYDVLINGKPYPPKEVMRYAHQQLDGEKRWEYSGGPQTFRYLEKFGFEVKKKAEGVDPVVKLIERYKSQIAESKLSDELYKWTLLRRFKGRPDLDNIDFYAEVKSIDFSNLIFHSAKVVMSNMARDRPNEYRLALRALFDENNPLIERMEEFRGRIDAIYRELGQTLGTHHDERTMSTLLTYHNPEKYTFYKDSYYRKYCDLLGIKPKKTGEKYVHYLELINDLITDYIADDSELLNLVTRQLSHDCFDDTNHRILAQDILYQMLDKSAVSNYWVFQANPSVYDLEEGLRNDIVDNWTVSAHKDKIKVGDKIILWSTGKKAGCYALAEVTEEPQKIGNLPDAHLWKVEDRNSYKAGINVTHNLVEEPLTQQQIRSTPGLQDLKAGTQGTNFLATKRQYEIIRDLVGKEVSDGKDGRVADRQTRMAKNTILYGPPGTGKTYNSIDKAVEIIDRHPSQDHAVNKLRFDELRQQGQIEFVTFHQNYSYEDFVVGIGPDITAGGLRFEKREGIFKLIVERAKRAWHSPENDKRTSSDFERVFGQLIEPLINKDASEIELPMLSAGNRFWLTGVDQDRTHLQYRKQTGRVNKLIIGKIKGLYEGSQTYRRDGDGVYYHALVKRLKEVSGSEFASNKTAHAAKNFVLVIDEINRANISKVFGELITLLEEDKRLGAKNELRVTLPNGEKDLGVPPNLFVIGTMNTADKSIALIDIALRRRFDFIGYYPRYDDLSDEAAELLRTVNSRIFEKKKSADYLIGHAYFMSGFPIETILRNKVIPLLTEYFAGKTDIVSDIFAGTTWSVSYNTDTFEWDISEN